MIKESLVYFLLVFAHQYSYLPLLIDAKPQIEFSKISTPQKQSKCDLEWIAQTSFNTGKITLRKDWDDKDPDDVCGLAHELTHYLQFINNRTSGNVETPAYKVSEMCYKILFHNHYNTTWASNQAKFFDKHQECQ